MASTEDAMAEALSERNSESEDFRAALKDDLDAIELLGKASEALGFFLQKNSRAVKKQQQSRSLVWSHGPEYDDTGAAPDTFSAPYGAKTREQGGGIQQIIQYLKEDLENEVLLAKESETKAQKAFEDQRLAAQRALEA